MHTRTVYFIAAEECQRVKIGVTNRDPVLRLQSMQTGSPFVLTLIGSVRELDLGLSEVQVHHKFAHLRCHGEWFHLEDDLQRYIRSAIRFNPSSDRLVISLADYKERQRQGIERAKEKGLYKGRKPSLSPLQAEEIHRRVREGEPKAALAREFKISRETLYQYIRNPVAKGDSCQLTNSLASIAD